ncbi:uncharacterized protein LOC115676669 [Syzygium oleosum]|uniref:uncharacterized protein LOC115676669 n=1 Tax=Syzygium oleosum TaxID=219896 RepID=UPI0011D198B6|nr:uncharacterized protein LOC115676669 [Syzygium oleosum]
MLGTGLQFRRVRGEDRFYVPVKARKNQNQMQRQSAVRSKNDESESPDSKRKPFASENGDSTEAANAVDKSSVVSRSNLDRFLDSTTPSVEAHYLSKVYKYFTLGGVCDSFKEWSAYGAGVPLLLDGRDSVVQYYVPYLSGIQLYGPSTNPNAKSRSAGEDSDVDCYRDSSSSDGSSDYELGKGMLSRNLQHYDHPANVVSSRIGRLSMSDEQSSGMEGFSSDDGDTGISRGCLLFEYMERDPPYSREPLADKVMDLARRFPALETFRSCDLLPSSWISVAWYPIYRIPTGPTLKDLDACFLTYHSLSTPLEGSGGTRSPVVVYPNETEGVPKIRLTVFGMASYKFKGSMWTQNGVSEHLMTNSLTRAAENWLRLRGVNHPDFQFFASHGMHAR